MDRSPRVHVPVLVKELVDLFQPIEDGTVVDMTVDGGGHARALLERPGNRCRLLGLDRDAAILEYAKRELEPFGDRVVLRHGPFDEVEQVFPELRRVKPRGIVFDLGLSSLQLDDPRRGFSFELEGPLDMRMDPADPLTAEEIVNSWSAAELEQVFRRYGEEPRSRRIAKAIVAARCHAPVKTTGALASIIERAAPRSPGRRTESRCFMAIRIVVNREIERFERALAQAIGLLAKGGRIAVVAFHSLEDRVAKEQFRAAARAGALRVLTRKPLVPTEAERRANPRSRSARLRAAEALH
ncbi:MAG: 16S rRNA (cytosine(1402)-N(4))-methyltransferase RsmH [Planctomycetota bacterium]